MGVADTSSPRKDHRARVLVADDDVKILRFLRSSLTLAGYEVATVTGGEEAIKLFESVKPGIVLLDILMSPMDGLEVLRKLRTSSELPIIAMSAHSSTAEEALLLGASDFLAKPFRPNELVKMIEKLLN